MAEGNENPVSYEQLENLEEEFEDVELEVIRYQNKLSKDLYVKRAKAIAEIDNFWPLVLEQAPQEIDECIQPTDMRVLAESLKGLTVDRFELPDGDPRSFSIRLEFSENEHFSDAVIEKKFWWRNVSGWAGHVSEPVEIQWKEGKDLTNGMLSLVRKIYDEERAGRADGDACKEAKRELKKKEDVDAMDGLSFFAWFGFRGRKISEEDHSAFSKKLEERRRARKEGKPEDSSWEENADDDDENLEDEYEFEIFPTGDDLAICIAEELWPNAIKYFLTAQEQDALSDIDFESDEEMGEDGDEADGDDGDAPPSKKRKA